MKYLLSCAVLFLATITLAQQQEQLPSTTTPPTFPEGPKTPKEPMPPETQAPSTEAMTSQEVEAEISHQLKAAPSLSGNNIDASVDKRSVVLTGKVETARQRDLAVRIAQSNAGDRQVVDKIKVKQET
jgi:hypothetical protein